MGRLWKAAIILMCTFVLSACAYKTAGEAIQNDIPFNIKQIIHKEEVEDGWLVFYTTEQKEGSKTFDALAVAYIKGSEKEGWENAGHNHWTYYKNDFMLLYVDDFTVFKEDGNLDVTIPVIFGKVLNPDIKAIEAAGPDGKFTKIEIIEKENERYYYAIGDYKEVRALNAEGKEIDRQGEKQ
ncbi:hypothetical protein J7E38_01335 [Bacillus sp. ISL-35]|uniref:hypothetical protein n=1 Tax=Bacillus sp. ISL-35 TaxID=2819122 RepID=UPI001BEB0709|nr:hypothetical protein [Bacillus sp. ISL-35]MBT2677621.1 hypothetical protein [Bacillus sp. ISL-35]MBT2701991.1 hypothetical protein [Chryseobacterium sp. ISL-80]